MTKFQNCGRLEGSCLLPLTARTKVTVTRAVGSSLVREKGDDAVLRFAFGAGLFRHGCYGKMGPVASRFHLNWRNAQHRPLRHRKHCREGPYPALRAIWKHFHQVIILANQHTWPCCERLQVCLVKARFDECWNLFFQRVYFCIGKHEKVGQVAIIWTLL